MAAKQQGTVDGVLEAMALVEPDTVAILGDFESERRYVTGEAAALIEATILARRERKLLSGVYEIRVRFTPVPLTDG